MAVTARRVGLYTQCHCLPIFAETFCCSIMIGGTAVAIKKAPFTFKGLFRSFETFMSIESSHQSILGGLTDMQSFCPSTIRQKLHGARRLTKRDAKSISDLLPSELENFTGSSSGSKNPACCRRVKATLIMISCANSLA